MKATDIRDGEWPREQRAVRIRRPSLLIVGLLVLLGVTLFVLQPWRTLPDAQTPAPGVAAGSLSRSAAAWREAGVTVARAHTTTRHTQVEALGTVTLDETRTARIGAVVDGKIIALSTEVGARVTAGAVLAEMHSQMVHAAWADYRKAIAERRRRMTELQYATQTEARTQRLFNAKAVSRQEVERAQVDRVAAVEALDMAKTEVRRTEEELEHLGVTSGDDPSGESGELIPVRSPLTGAVLEKHVTVGTAVTPGTLLFVVSDLSTLWALAEVDETTLPFVQVGRAIAVRVAAYPNETFPGTIIFVGDTLDPKTRRVSVRCRVPNPQGRLKPNMYATLALGESSTQVVVTLPSAAIQEVNGKQVVFTTENGQEFALREVMVGREADGHAEILSGLHPGEHVAVTGSFLLKSQILQAAEPAEE